MPFTLHKSARTFDPTSRDEWVFNSAQLVYLERTEDQARSATCEVFDGSDVKFSHDAEQCCATAQCMSPFTRSATLRFIDSEIGNQTSLWRLPTGSARQVKSPTLSPRKTRHGCRIHNSPIATKRSLSKVTDKNRFWDEQANL